MTWGHKRQLVYLSVIFIIFIAIIVSLYFWYKPTPTCFDGKMNQTELGVDCGGACNKACVSQLTPLTIWWSRVFPSSKGVYDVAVLVENQNIDFGTKKINYLLRVYDKYNVLIAERQGETFFNPREKFVIYESNIETKEQVAEKVFIFFDEKAVWQKIKVTSPLISIGAKNYFSTPQTRLQSNITNNSLDILRDTKFVAVLSDKDGNALSVSQTVVDVLLSNESRELNFTWSTPLLENPATIDIYPKLNLFDEISLD